MFSSYLISKGVNYLKKRVDRNHKLFQSLPVILRVLVHDVLPVSLSHTRFRPKGVMVIARRGF